MSERLYLDTEFNGHGGELISLALVGEVGGIQHKFYEATQFIGPVDAWVAEHVLPKLGTVPLKSYIFRRNLHAFLSFYRDPEIICDWHADAEHFCRMLAGPDYASSMDFACRITILKTPPGYPVSKNPHNALADALALMEWHQEAMAA